MNIKKHLLRNWTGYAFLIPGVSFWGIYSYIGSYVASDGTLVEPFFLIPLGLIFISIGCIILILKFRIPLIIKILFLLLPAAVILLLFWRLPQSIIELFFS